MVAVTKRVNYIKFLSKQAHVSMFSSVCCNQEVVINSNLYTTAVQMGEVERNGAARIKVCEKCINLLTFTNI